MSVVENFLQSKLDPQPQGQPEQVVLTVYRNMGAATFEEKHVAPQAGANAREILHSPLISVKVVGINTGLDHSGGT